MLKSKWIASVLALALIVTPVQGVTAAETVTETETGTLTVTETETGTVTGTETGTETDAVTDTEAATTSGENAVTEKLDAPTGVTWELPNGFNIYPKWNEVKSKTESGVYYSVDISYNDGEEYKHFNTTTQTQFWL